MNRWDDGGEAKEVHAPLLLHSFAVKKRILKAERETDFFCNLGNRQAIKTNGSRHGSGKKNLHHRSARLFFFSRQTFVGLILQTSAVLLPPNTERGVKNHDQPQRQNANERKTKKGKNCCGLTKKKYRRNLFRGKKGVIFIACA